MDLAVQGDHGVGTRLSPHPSTYHISSYMFRVKHQTTAIQLCVFSVKNRLAFLALAVGPLAILPPVASSCMPSRMSRSCEQVARDTMPLRVMYT